jgi:multidrug efflux pump subunit AcrB
MFNLFYRNRPLLILSIFLILVWGLSSFFSLPRMEDPVGVERTALVTTRFPGATPERVEALVSEPIERALYEIEEIDSIDSTSRAAFSSIYIELYDWVKEVEPVWSRVRDRLNDVAAQLPSQTQEPEFEEIEIRANAAIVALTWDLKTPVNYAILRRWSEELEDRLRTVTGTEKIEYYGAPNEEIAVEVNSKALAGLGLTTQELVAQIQNSDAKVSAGQLRGEQNDLLLEVEGELDSLERIRQIPIRASDTGQFAQLGDIARVEKGIAMPATRLAWVSGKSAIALGVLVEANRRLDVWKEAADEVLAEFRSELPQGVGLQIVLDQSRYVATRIDSVIQELIVGSLLAMTTVFLLMGWRSALVVGITLPLSALMVFGEMNVMGIPLHQISIVGMIIALGLLIDNAIVIADEVQVRLQKGMAAADAIAQSVRMMLVPLLSSTLTTAFAFLPIALAPGSIGEFVNTIGITAILGLFSSLFVSLTILPALAGKLQDWRPIGNTAWWQKGFSHPRLTRIYRSSLDTAFGKPILAISLALILPAIGFTVFPHLEEQFFPPTGRDQFAIEIELPSQASIKETESTVLIARDLIREQSGIEDVHWFVGSNAPKIYYNSPSGWESSNYAQGIVQLYPGIQPRQAILNLQQKLDRAFPQAQVLVRQLEQGPYYNAPVEMRLYGPDLEQLQVLGDRVRTELAKVDRVIQTRATLSESLPKLSLSLDEEQARLANLDRTAIAEQLDTTLEGTLGGSVLEGTEELPVRVRLSNRDRADLSQLSSLNLRGSESQQSIPLSALGKLQLVPEGAAIVRRNGQRMNTISGFITAGILPSVVLKDFQARLNEDGFTLPQGYRLEIGGEAEERNTAVANLVSTVGVLGVLMLATLVLTFNSFILAGAIVVIAILSAGLGFLALWVGGYPFGFIAVLGTVGLIGIAVNEATVTLSAILEDEWARLGDRKAVGEVVMHATRHMITTTVTDVAGFAPLLVDPTGFWNPLAIVIAGGLGATTLLTLYLLPAVYVLLKRKTERSIQQVVPRSSQSH